MTEADLASRKVANARLIADGARAGRMAARRSSSTSGGAVRWMRSLTDIRLVLASRIGIRDDGESQDDASEAALALREAYDALGALQESLRRRGGRLMALALDEATFEALVVDELDLLPDEMVDGLDNIVFVTEARPEDGSLDLLGLYDGIGAHRARPVRFRRAARPHRPVPRTAAGDRRGPRRSEGSDPHHPRARDRALLRHRRRAAARTGLGLAARRVRPPRAGGTGRRSTPRASRRRCARRSARSPRA